MYNRCVRDIYYSPASSVRRDGYVAVFTSNKRIIGGHVYYDWAYCCTMHDAELTTNMHPFSPDGCAKYDLERMEYLYTVETYDI